MSTLTYTIGDATLPLTTEPTIIAHCCNDQGAWGAGFVIPLGNRYPVARQAYHAWARNQIPAQVKIPIAGQGQRVGRKVYTHGTFMLGSAMIVPVAENLWVANLIGQVLGGKRPPIRYASLALALEHLAKVARELRAVVQMPRMGAGLAGGSWEAVEAIVYHELVDQGISVTVIDLPQQQGEWDV